MAPFAGARQMKNRGGLSLGRDGNPIAGTEQTRATNQGPYAFVGYAGEATTTRVTRRSEAG